MGCGGSHSCRQLGTKEVMALQYHILQATTMDTETRGATPPLRPAANLRGFQWQLGILFVVNKPPQDLVHFRRESIMECRLSSGEERMLLSMRASAYARRHILTPSLLTRMMSWNMQLRQAEQLQQHAAQQQRPLAQMARRMAMARML